MAFTVRPMRPDEGRTFLDGRPVGLGCLIVRDAELRACYVVPEAWASARL
jgi:hypothetical protein